MQQQGKALTVPVGVIGAAQGFNPTILLLLGSIVLGTASTTGYWVWGWSHWLVFVCNFSALYVLGTVIHDASHGVAHPNRIVNAAIGHISAILQGFVFPVFTRVHMQHHAHVNDEEDDPDHYVSTGGPLWLIAARFFYHEIFFFQRRLWRNYELLEWAVSRLIVVATIIVGYHWGFLGYMLNFWFVPAAVMGLLLGLFFDYLPHRPFVERSRWKNARVYPSRFLNIMLLGQKYGLLHHLWPNVPWYYYETTYYQMKPLLDANGSPQTLGIFKMPDLAGFIYDLFLGIRFHGHKPKPTNSKGDRRKKQFSDSVAN